MTGRDSVRAIVRRWYVLAAALLVAGVLGGAFWADSGVYSTRTVVSFMYPYESALTPDNATSNESVIAFAGAVALMINPDSSTVKYSSSNAPYYGAGLREGVFVGLEDEGTQWAPSFSSAVIEIQVVGSTEAWVMEQQTALLQNVTLVTAALQDETGIEPGDRITARVEPLTMAIDHITPSRTAQVAAAGALALAGSMVGAWAAISLEWRASRRPRRTTDPETVLG